MFDLSKLDTRSRSEAGVPMPVLNPRTTAPMLDDKGNPVTITLLGPNSEVFKTKSRELQQRRSDFAARGVKMTDEDFQRERFDLLVAVTRGWSELTMDGKPFPYSPENVRLLWGDQRWDWLQLQSWAYVQQDGNFLPS